MAYNTIQCGSSPEDNLVLNSDLLYGDQIGKCNGLEGADPPHPVNHSCEPNVVYDFSSEDPSQWHLRASRPIKVGDPCRSQSCVRSGSSD